MVPFRRQVSRAEDMWGFIANNAPRCSLNYLDACLAARQPCERKERR
jgi:hypothetical protein